MSLKPKRRKCRCCSELFLPDYRNRERQHYCGKPGCRHASKVASQRRWFRKPGNRDYFRGPKEVERVRTWRKAHPGYWKKKPAAKPSTQVTIPSRLPRKLGRSHLVTHPAALWVRYKISASLRTPGLSGCSR
jgi:hypothetical protein